MTGCGRKLGPSMMTAKVYSIKGHPEVEIARCPSFVSPIGNKPAYWYVRKTLHSWDDRLLWEKGLRTWYWTGTEWRHNTPKQFRRASQALSNFLRMTEK